MPAATAAVETATTTAKSACADYFQPACAARSQPAKAGFASVAATSSRQGMVATLLTAVETAPTTAKSACADYFQPACADRSQPAQAGFATVAATSSRQGMVATLLTRPSAGSILSAFVFLATLANFGICAPVLPTPFLRHAECASTRVVVSVVQPLVGVRLRRAL
jgi:hypothetical protein